MKILLVDPHYHLPNDNYKFSLGLAYIAAQCSDDIDVEGYTFELSKIPLTLEEFQHEELMFLERLKDYIREATIVGITTTMGSYGRMLKIANIAKEMGKTVIVGGSHITFLLTTHKWKNVIFEDSKNNIDVTFNGESDYSINLFLKAYKENKNYHQIPGISFISDNDIIHNKENVEIIDVNNLKMPRWDLLGIRGINTVAYIAMSRGCKYNCRFCDERILFKKYRFRNIDNIVNEIENNFQKYEIRKYRFCDSSFTSHPLVEELCDKISNLDLNLAWIAYARVDEVVKKKNLLLKMKKAGCKCIYFGLESGNEYILEKARKNIRISDMRLAFKLAREAGLKIKSSFILGLPGETKKSIIDTINIAKELNPDIINWHLFAPNVEFLENELKNMDIIWKNVQTDIPDSLIPYYSITLGHRAVDLWVERHIGFRAEEVPSNLPEHICGLSYKELYIWLKKAISETKQNTEAESVMLNN